VFPRFLQEIWVWGVGQNFPHVTLRRLHRKACHGALFFRDGFPFRVFSVTTIVIPAERSFFLVEVPFLSVEVLPFFPPPSIPFFLTASFPRPSFFHTPRKYDRFHYSRALGSVRAPRDPVPNVPFRFPLTISPFEDLPSCFCFFISNARLSKRPSNELTRSRPRTPPFWSSLQFHRPGLPDF